MSKFASRLINYVEPVQYNGINKTAFYTEFGTNLQIGDKVFVINGNYDSNNLINSSTFSIGTDGYTILDIDRCRIVLDIDFTGSSVYNQDSINNFIKLHNVSSQREFDYINTISTNSYATYSSKFEFGLTNDIIYSSGSFSGTSSLIGKNNGVTSSGFYQKQTSTNNWINISASFSSGTIFFKTTGAGFTYSLTNNSRLLIVGENIIIGSNSVYDQRNIYTYNNGWIIDNTYNNSYISRLNFRNGKFKGTWNEGVFGSYVSSINWDNTTSVWNSGILVNSSWKVGTLNSLDTKSTTTTIYTSGLYDPTFTTLQSATPSILTYLMATVSRTIDYNSPIKQADNTIQQSYYCSLDQFGNPIQSTDFSNNKGFGFNYIIDSNIETGTIYNGNFENCNIGLTSYGVNSLDIYYGLSFSYLLSTYGGSYKLCDINTTAIANSSIENSNIINSNVINTKLSSNQITNTAASGNYDSSNGINIIAADLWSYVIGLTTSQQKRGVLKLFINDDDVSRISDFDTIYIDKLNKDIYITSFTDDTKIYLNYENKYIFDYFNNSDLTSNGIIVSSKNSNDNIYSTYITLSGTTYSNTFTPNPNNYASIDIDLADNLAWYYNGTSSIYVNSNPIITTDSVNNLFANTQISNSSFNSGILVNSDWIQGDNFNDKSNIIKYSGGSYSMRILTGSTNSVYVDVSNDIHNKYDTLNIGDYIWISGLNYGTSSTINFSATFKVSGLSSSTLPSARRFILREQTNVIASNSLSNGYFTIPNLAPTYISLNKFRIDNTDITAGMFKSSNIVNSTFFNQNYNTLDRSLLTSNTNLLRFINQLFKDDNNIINSGTIYQSHIINTNWTNGISFNSLLYGNTFSNGIFKSGYWNNGIFNNGIFSDSYDKVTSTSSYELTSNYKSWRNGTFNNGQLYNSIWIDGTFNNGRLFNSTWYGGIWNNGILGIQNSPYINTVMGYLPNLSVGSTYTVWNNGIVESGIVGGSSSIYWNNGKFNDGEFISFGKSFSSIWYNGDFNGGRFDGYAKWKNGNFNKGKFISYYGWTSSGSTNSIDYSWENGNFNGGQFGQPNLATNSTWYDGIFNDGSFYGRVWNSGVFTKGNFFGSSLTQSYKNEASFVNSFTSSYYGMWRDGYLVDSIHLGKPNQKIYTDIKRATDTKKITSNVLMQNALWLNGTFSHANGTTDNIVWLNGSFIKGNFNNSAFNPYVDRTLRGLTGSTASSFNFGDSCKWINGNFNGGTYYISEWLNGTFLNGYMLGGIWRDGVWYYGSAENCYWQDGTWKNGNWYGTNFDDMTISTASYTANDPMTQAVLYNIASASGTSSIHLLNAFTGSSSAEILYDPNLIHAAASDFRGWTQSGSTPWVFSSSYTNTIYVYNPLTHHYTVMGGSSILGSNYQFDGTVSSNKLFALSHPSGFTTSIFGSASPYVVKFNIHINYTNLTHESFAYPVGINVDMGFTNSVVYCNTGLNSFIINLTSDQAYTWTTANPKLDIYKLATPFNVVETALLNMSVTRTSILYDSTKNNKLINAYNSASASLLTTSSTVSFPGLVLETGGISLQYGNGKFVSGVWENGIWNNGYRDDTTLTRCKLYPVAGYIKISKSVHRVQLSFLDTNNSSLYNLGDYVSVGNLVSTDINGNRKLLKDKLKVVYIGPSNIVLECTLNYPISQIVQDSDKHVIYLSKNIWLSGGFLNGYFNGIWNYGLFKGYPYITYMNDSYWIDGIFDGGHFKSSINSVSDPTTGLTVSYNTGLVQNFIFKDNNVAAPTTFLYDSWMDVNYTMETQTNIYQDKNYYANPAASLVPGIFSKPNLNGLITYDILSSNSYFRNGYDNNIKNYNLGVKYTTYIDYLSNIGGFDKLFSKSLPSLGLDNFNNDGWNITSLVFDGNLGHSVTYSFIYTPLSTTIYPELFTLENTDNTLVIMTTTFSNDGIGHFPSTSLQNYVVLDNINTQTVPNQRYTMLQYDILSWTGFAGPTFGNPRSLANNTVPGFFPPAINSMIYPATYSLTQYVTNPLFNNNVTKREFFYNRHSLLMELVGGGITTPDGYPLEVQFDNMSFYEVDMIPFFSYTTESNVDQSIKTPWTAIAPFIDYSNSNFNYIGNVNLTIDTSFVSSSASVYNAGNSGNIFNGINLNAGGHNLAFTP